MATGAIAGFRQTTVGDHHAARTDVSARFFHGGKPNSRHRGQQQDAVGTARHVEPAIGGSGAFERFEVEEIEVAISVEEIFSEMEGTVLGLRVSGLAG